jgi:hypothetical protein
MMVKNFIYSTALYFILFSCEKHSDLNPDPRKYEDGVTLHPADTLIIPIGYRSNVYSRYLKAVEINNNSYLGIVNENTNELEFYSLDDSETNFRISYQQEGPNGIGSIKAFEIISDSTLLVATTYRVRLYVTDFKGNVVKTIKTDNSKRRGKPFVQIYYTNQPLLFDKTKQDAYVFTRVDTDYNGPGIWSGTMFLKASTINDGSNNHVFDLPTHFDKYIHGSVFCHGSHLLIDDRYLVLGITFYNNLLIFDLKKERMMEGKAGSKHFGDALPWDSPDMDGDVEFYVTSNSYREITYDKENKLLYRLAYRGVDYIGPDGLRRNWDNKPPSVIIINSDFEKVGEVDLPVNTIYTRMFFTHNGKLYLSLNHPDNNPSEDQMVFVGFKPEKL